MQGNFVGLSQQNKYFNTLLAVDGIGALGAVEFLAAAVDRRSYACSALSTSRISGLPEPKGNVNMKKKCGRLSQKIIRIGPPRGSLHEEE